MNLIMNILSQITTQFHFKGSNTTCKRCTFHSDFYNSPEKIRYADFTITALSKDVTNSTMMILPVTQDNFTIQIMEYFKVR